MLSSSTKLQFFPVLSTIEKEVKGLDKLVHGTTNTIPVGDDATEHSSEANEKRSSVYKVKKISKYSQINWPLSSMWVQLRKYIVRLRWLHAAKQKEEKAREAAHKAKELMYSAGRTLQRMAATRRIVTSLGRLLATKDEVITQIRKRLQPTAYDPKERGVGLDMQDDREIAIYMGDVQGKDP